MKNGDRLTGPIVKSDGKVFIIKTEYRLRSDDLAIAMEADGTAQSTTVAYVHLQFCVIRAAIECCATTFRLGNATSLLTG